MDLHYAVSNLKEAMEHLAELISRLETSGNVEILNGESMAAYQEIYWHINRVWNAREIPQAKIDEANDAEFDEWCRFPKDLDI